MSLYGPGLLFKGWPESSSTNQHNKVMEIITQIRKANLCSLDDAKEIYSNTPYHVSFDEMIEKYNDRQVEQKLPADFEMRDALDIANGIIEELTGYGYVAELIESHEEGTEGEDPIVTKLAKHIKNGAGRRLPKVVQLRGPTGVGKTARVRAACKAAGFDPYDDTQVMVVSMPTKPPEDLVGIPSPDLKNDQEFYYRQLKGMTTCKVLFLDEANRAHPKNQNAMLQLINEKRINNVHYDNLQCIFLAINPPEDGNYNGAYDLDEAFNARTHHYYDIDGRPDADIIARLITNPDGSNADDAKQVAKVAVQWWENLKSADQKKKMDPRRLEFLCQAWLDEESIETTIDKKGANAVVVNLSELQKMLRNIKVLNMQTLLRDHQEIRVKLEAEPNSKESADLLIRIADLFDDMARKKMYKEFATVAHLMDYVRADMIPAPDRDKGKYTFMTKAMDKVSTKAGQDFRNTLAKRAQERSIVRKEIGNASDRLNAAKANNPDAVSI